MRKRLKSFAAAAFVATLGSATGGPLPPDLTMEIADIHTGTQSGAKVLFFSTWTVNRGIGPMELRGGPVVNGMQEVYQRVFNSDGSFNDTYAGTFTVVAGKIKFQDSADYYLREVNEDNSVGEIVSAQEKVSYCLVDSMMASNSPPGTPAQAQYGGQLYSACGNILGISIGWVDNYFYTLPNQWVSLTAIPSGTYWLQNIIDPLGRFVETDNENNETHVKVTFTTTYAAEMDLLGNGLAIANNAAAPNASDGTDFGYARIGTDTVTRTFTIQNNGSGKLSLTGVPRVKIAGSSDFVVTAQPASPVAPGSSTTFQISFHPTGMNAAAQVVITNNDSNEAPYQFAVRGNANTGNADTDSDGMPDAWEALYNLNDPAGDEDGDGLSNREEFIAGTSPLDPRSAFEIAKVEQVAGGFAVTWDSIKGRNYHLFASGDPSASSPWELVSEQAGTGESITVSEMPAGAAPRFYRLVVGF